MRVSEYLDKCHFGDCLETLRQMPSGLANTCVTSPPYFGLRNYSGGDAEIGKEKTPEEFIAKLVAVFREVKRVLRDDGTCWVNMGDSYGKGKQLLGIPWRLAFALQTDGWILRQDIVWQKPNPMPESVRDRCTKSHEYIFLFSKSEKYYFDQGAIKEPAVKGAAGSEFHTGKTGEHQLGRASEIRRSKRDSLKRDDSKRAEVIPSQTVGTHRPDREESEWDTDTRNKRSVWTVSTKPYSGAHFAVFPPELIEPCILAGAPAGGVVLDPFFGSGTSGQVSQSLGRHFIGCELNSDYKSLQDERLRQPAFIFDETTTFISEA